MSRSGGSRAHHPDSTGEGPTRRPMALVTGASGGVGGAVVRRLADDGFRVLATGRSEERLERLRREPSAVSEGRVETVAADLCRADGRQRLYASLRERSRGLDVLVLSHGVFARGLGDSSDEEALQRIIDTNFTSRALIFTELLPLLVRRRGHVFEVSSTAARGVRPDVPWYSASMAGSLSFFRNVHGADEVKNAVAVCSVVLGRTATPMQEEVMRLESRPFRPEELLSPEAVAAFVAARLAAPAEAGRTAEVVLLPPGRVAGADDGGGS